MTIMELYMILKKENIFDEFIEYLEKNKNTNL